MKTKEFNLSEKIREWWERNYIIPSSEFIKLEKIYKEFIKRLKEEIVSCEKDDFFWYKKKEIHLCPNCTKKLEIIDKLAGEKLTNERNN